MREPLGALRRRGYRHSVVKDIGVIEAIDALLADVRDEEERQRLERLRAAIAAHRQPCPRRR
jgi:hypothetical protein